MAEDIPLVVIFKAMGLASDQEIMQLIGMDVDAQKRFSASLVEASNLKVFTQKRALEFMGSKLIVKRFQSAMSKPKSPSDEARELLQTTILAHVPVENFNFQLKCVYVALMVRRVMAAEMDRTTMDDR